MKPQGLPHLPAARPHYLVICGGTTGDIHPFMRIAHALQAMGRRVTFITNTYHARLLKGSGLAFVGLGTDEDYLRFIEDPDIWHPRKGFAAILAQYKDQLLQIDEAIRSVVGTDTSNPATFVIAHPFTVPGAAMARECGLVGRIASVYLAPSTIRTCHDPMRIGDIAVPRWVPMSWRRALWRFTESGWIDPVGIGHTNAARGALKLPPVTVSFLPHVETAPDLTITAFPSWFGPAMPDWPQPLLSADFQLFDAEPADRFSPELQAFLAAGEPPVVFTPGTGNVHASAFFTCACAARRWPAALRSGKTRRSCVRRSSGACHCLRLRMWVKPTQRPKARSALTMNTSSDTCPMAGPNPSAGTSFARSASSPPTSAPLLTTCTG